MERNDNQDLITGEILLKKDNRADLAFPITVHVKLALDSDTLLTPNQEVGHDVALSRIGLKADSCLGERASNGLTEIDA
jgi:hypothetical protein